MTPEEVNIRLDTELNHLASTADLHREMKEMHREMAIQTRWLIGTMIALQIPTWVGMIQLWVALKH